MVCKTCKNKKELFRFVAADNIVCIDFYNKLEGRGFYTCKTYSCITGLNEKTVNRALKKSENLIFDKENILKILHSNLINQVKNTLKLSNKSGVVIGTQNAFNKAVEEKKNFDLIFIAKDISENSYKKIKYCSAKTKINNALFNKEDLGRIIGKNEANVIGILYSSFSEMIKKQLDTIENIFEGAYSNGNGNKKNSQLG